MGPRYYIMLQHAVMVLDEGNNNRPQDLQAPSNVSASLIRSFTTMTCRDPEDDKHTPCTGASSRPMLTICEVFTNTVLDRFANNI